MARPWPGDAGAQRADTGDILFEALSWPSLPVRSGPIRQGLNFTLVTQAGDLDLLGEATGGGTYEALLPHSEVRDVAGLECRFVDLETLIRLKRAAGRPKDLERIAELEALRQEDP